MLRDLHHFGFGFNHALDPRLRLDLLRPRHRSLRLPSAERPLPAPQRVLALVQGAFPFHESALLLHHQALAFLQQRRLFGKDLHLGEHFLASGRKVLEHLADLFLLGQHLFLGSANAAGQLLQLSFVDCGPFGQFQHDRLLGVQFLVAPLDLRPGLVDLFLQRAKFRLERVELLLPLGDVVLPWQ